LDEQDRRDSLVQPVEEVKKKNEKCKKIKTSERKIFDKDKVSYEPFFVTLMSIMVEDFHSNRKAGTRFHGRSSIHFNPTFENTTKPSFT
jgi:hypothetical protein